MADELDLSEKKNPPYKSKPLIIGGVAFVAIAIGAALYFMGIFPAGQVDQGETTEKEETEIPKTPIYISLDPAFVVGFGNKKGAKLLQLSISVLSYKQETIDAIEKHKPMVRNNLLLLFNAHDPLELKTIDGKNRLRKEAFDAIAQVIKEIEGLDGIEDVFFTRFVMQ